MNKIVKQIPYYLLALVFLGGGLSFFFMKQPDMQLNENGTKFMEVFGGTGYMKFIKVCEVLFGAMLLWPKTRNLGLILAAPIVVNILAFEIFIANQPGIGIALLIITALGFFFNKERFMHLLD